MRKEVVLSPQDEADDVEIVHGEKKSLGVFKMTHFPILNWVAISHYY
jgi:hypothetical protein